MERIYYKPTEEEAEICGRAAFNAAFHEIQALNKIEDRFSAGVAVFLNAFKEAVRARKGAEKELLAAHPEYHGVHLSADDAGAVYSAFGAFVIGYPPNESSVNSVLGGQFAMFAQATRALEAMSNLTSAFEDDDTLCGVYMAEETADFAKAFIEARS